MGSFLFKHPSKWRWPSKSKSQPAKARSSNYPGFKPPIPNGSSSPTEARVIVPSRSIDIATAPHEAYFAPLESIGRLGTAASTNAARTGRPATSHATTNSFTHHEVNACCVSTEPASAYSKPPKSSAYSPKPELLDHDHPVYRKVPETDKNVHRCTTKKNTDQLNLRKSPRRDQLRPQFEETNQGGAANTSILSTSGQEPDAPPPRPLPSQAKHSPPSQMISSGTSSSLRRGQQPRPYRDDAQRRAVSTTNSPSQGQESYDSQPPPLPARRYSSDASTIFSDTGETAIATEELDLPALLRSGRNFGLRRSRFDWETNQSALRFAEWCIRKLKNDDRRTIDAVTLLQTGTSFESTVEAEHAEKAWFLLSPDKRSLRIRYITEGFCKYFFHIYYSLRSGVEIPYQVPVHIRAEIDLSYRSVWSKMKSVRAPENKNLAEWISDFDGEKQGIRLIALLEIRMHDRGPLESRDLLRSVLESIERVESLVHVSEDKISNFFVTYGRAFSVSLRDVRENNAILEASLEYFRSFWVLCTAQYSDHIAGNYLSLFKATIRKLDNIDIPLCLWIFLAGSGTSLIQDLKQTAVGELYLAMKAELSVRLPNEFRGLISSMMTVQFLLSAGRPGFFDIMHNLMHAQGVVPVWKSVWEALQHGEMYTMLSQHTDADVATVESVIPIFLESW